MKAINNAMFLDSCGQFDVNNKGPIYEKRTQEEQGGCDYYCN
jgi:hypothetical protein